MNNKRTFKALLLLISIFFLYAFSVVDMQAQSVNSGFEGTWVLDSVQVKEVMPESIIEKTVLPGDDNEYIINRMWQITLDIHGRLFYKVYGSQDISDATYVIEDRSGDTATLVFKSPPIYSIFKTQLLSQSSMIMTHSFTIGRDMKDIEVFYKMFYRKINK